MNTTMATLGDWFVYFIVALIVLLAIMDDRSHK